MSMNRKDGYKLPIGPDDLEIIEDAGIFTKVSRRLRTGNVAALQRTLDLGAMLEGIEATAMTILGDLPRGPVVVYSDNPHPKQVEAGERHLREARAAEARGERPPCWETRRATPQQRDAADCIWWAWHLRKALADGDTKAVALAGFHLGQVHARMMVRPAEPSTMTGRKVRGGGRKGAKLAESHWEGKRESHKVVYAAFQSLRKKEPDLPITEVTQRIVERFGWSAKTIGNIRRKFDGRKRNS